MKKLVWIGVCSVILFACSTDKVELIEALEPDDVENIPTKYLSDLWWKLAH